MNPVSAKGGSGSEKNTGENGYICSKKRGPAPRCERGGGGEVRERR